eukprot:TRINITY_DN8754_c0_g1_i1.p1 TRINITY_DN8754_c0_g1~~TRINITY_DN8754_c0_g1_i1.p1  ORF type:complete len:478 (-),score=128.64 TRINITY_DN8754_c0_g1_i1:15-1448(-)
MAGNAEELPSSAVSTMQGCDCGRERHALERARASCEALLARAERLRAFAGALAAWRSCAEASRRQRREALFDAMAAQLREAEEQRASLAAAAAAAAAAGASACLPRPPTSSPFEVQDDEEELGSVELRCGPLLAAAAAHRTERALLAGVLEAWRTASADVCRDGSVSRASEDSARSAAAVEVARRFARASGRHGVAAAFAAWRREALWARAVARVEASGAAGAHNDGGAVVAVATAPSSAARGPEAARRPRNSSRPLTAVAAERFSGQGSGIGSLRRPLQTLQELSSASGVGDKVPPTPRPPSPRQPLQRRLLRTASAAPRLNAGGGATASVFPAAVLPATSAAAASAASATAGDPESPPPATAGATAASPRLEESSGGGKDANAGGASATAEPRKLRGPERFFYDTMSYTGCARFGGPAVVDKKENRPELRAPISTGGGHAGGGGRTPVGGGGAASSNGASAAGAVAARRRAALPR